MSQKAKVKRKGLKIAFAVICYFIAAMALFGGLCAIEMYKIEPYTEENTVMLHSVIATVEENDNGSTSIFLVGDSGRLHINNDEVMNKEALAAAKAGDSVSFSIPKTFLEFFEQGKEGWVVSLQVNDEDIVTFESVMQREIDSKFNIKITAIVCGSIFATIGILLTVLVIVQSKKLKKSGK